MENPSKHDKLNTILKMIYQLAIGNHSFRISIEQPCDDLDQIALKLNNIADRLEIYVIELKQEHSTQNEPQNNAAVELANKIQVYIHNNLSAPLPSIKKLAELFKTNDYFLKDSFKKTTNNSIYQYYNDERLKKSHQLIQETQIPLKEIAFQCGFNSYLNFYKAFRKKFNYTPTTVIRKSNLDNQTTD
jgi:transcriptional regulator GlxA family with amidase domain